MSNRRTNKPSLLDIQAEQERDNYGGSGDGGNSGGGRRVGGRNHNSNSNSNSNYNNSNYNNNYNNKILDLPLEQGLVCGLKDSFGFIYCADREEELFFHYSQVQNIHPSDLKVDDCISFRVGPSKNNPDKMAGFLVEKLDVEELQWDVEEHPGKRFKGIVERALPRNNSSSVMEGSIKILSEDDEEESDEKTAKFIKFTAMDYQPQPEPSSDRSFRRSNSSSSFSGASSRLGLNDVVEFTLVTYRRNKTQYARNITLIQSDRERQRLANASLEQGIVITLKDGFGFLKSNKRRGEVYFHYSQVQFEDEDVELTTGQEMEFLVVGEGNEKISARQVKLLPKGTVKFRHLLAEGVSGVITRCPHPSDSRYSSDFVGEVILTNPIQHEENTITTVAFFSNDAPGGTYAENRDGSSMGLWVREGDTLLFDVVQEILDGLIRLYPTKCNVGEEETNEAKPSVKLVATSLAGRQEGVIHAIINGYGFIHCSERPIDVYFKLYELLPESLQSDLLKGLDLSTKEKLTLDVGVEVQFDLALQKSIASRSSNGRGREKESLKAQRLLLLPPNTVLQNKTLVMGMKAVVQKEDPKQPYAGTIELEEQVVPMTDEERHPLLTKFLNSILERMEKQESGSVIYHDMQSHRDEEVILSMTQSLGNGKLSVTHVPVAGESKYSGRICISWGGAACNTEEERKSNDGAITDEDVITSDDGMDDDPSSTKRRKRKKKPKKNLKRPVSLVRYDKHSLSDELRNAIPLAEGDIVTCDVVQSRRSGLVTLANIKVVERKTPVPENQDDQEASTGVGIITEVVNSRKFGFIALFDDGASRREVLFFQFKDVIASNAAIRKGDEARFQIHTKSAGKRVASEIEILPRGTLDIPTKASKDACHGIVLMEPSHTSLSDTPVRKKGGRSISPKPEGGAAKRWEKEEQVVRKIKPLVKEEGFILLTKDPLNMFSPKSAEDAGGEDTGDKDAASVVRIAYKNGAVAMHGAGSTSLSDSSNGPRRGDLISFIKSRKGNGVRDIRVVSKRAATLLRGRLEDINVGEGTAKFVAATEKGEVYNIVLSELVSCDLSLLKEKEQVEGILHEGQIYGVCRTTDLYLESKLGGQHRQRPKLNLTVRKELGGKIMAQSRMAKGPDGTNGFVSGWTQRTSAYVDEGDETKPDKSDESTPDVADEEAEVVESEVTNE